MLLQGPALMQTWCLISTNATQSPAVWGQHCCLQLLSHCVRCVIYAPSWISWGHDIKLRGWGRLKSPSESFYDYVIKLGKRNMSNHLDSFIVWISFRCLVYQFRSRFQNSQLGAVEAIYDGNAFELNRPLRKCNLWKEDNEKKISFAYYFPNSCTNKDVTGKLPVQKTEDVYLPFSSIKTIRMQRDSFICLTLQ